MLKDRRLWLERTAAFANETCRGTGRRDAFLKFLRSAVRSSDSEIFIGTLQLYAFSSSRCVLTFKATQKNKVDPNINLLDQTFNSINTDTTDIATVVSVFIVTTNVAKSENSETE